LQSIAQSLGFLFFVILAGYGLITILSGTGPVARAAPAQQDAPAQQTALVIPTLINYQGYLLDGDGNTLDGTHQIIFRIYDSPAAGATPLHEETHTAIQVRNGYFSVLLGDQVGKPLPANVFSSANRYIGIQVAPHEEMIPRQRLASVAYAFTAANAANADNLDGRDSSQFATFNSLAAADHNPAQAVVVDNDGRVGVGTAAPEFDLDLADPDGDGTAEFRLVGGGAGLEFFTNAGDSYIRGRGPRALRFGTNATERVRIEGETGYMGIGTSSPDFRLDVNGDINSRGRFLVDGQEPFFIKEYKLTGRQHLNLKVDPGKFACGVFDFRAYNGDIYEYGNGTSELIDVDVYESGGNTMLFADFRTHSGAEETWYVTVLCIHEDLVRYN